MITLDNIGILKIYTKDLFGSKFKWIDADDGQEYTIEAVAVHFDNDSVMIEVAYPETSGEKQINLPLYINYDLLEKI